MNAKQPRVADPVLPDETDSALHLEIDVLADAVWRPAALAVAIEELEEHDFQLPSTRQAFKLMRQLFEAGETVDKITLRGRIDNHLWLALEPPSTFDTEGHVRRLRQLSQVRFLRSLGMELSEGPASVELLTQTLDVAVGELARREKMRGTDLCRAVVTVKEKRQAGDLSAFAIDYPWHKVNACTRGLRPGWLCYLAGRPGEGKTAAAIELAFSAAKAGKRVLFCSLEMDPEELAVRMAQRFGLDSEDFYMTDMHDSDWRALDKAIQHPALKHIQIEYASTVSKLTALVRAQKPELVIVDYVQLMDHCHDSRLEGTTQTSNALKRLARRYHVPIVALSQLSRPPKDANGKLPELTDLRDSGSLEQDADQVIFVWRQHDKRHHIPTPEGMFIVAKARMGRPGKQQFRFNGDRQTFALVDAEA